MKKSIFKKLGGLFLGLAMGLGVAVGVTAGNKASEVKAAGDTTYTFTSKSWGSNATGNDVWSSGKDGGQFTANQGIQVTKALSGVNGTSGKSFSNVSKVVVNYCTNNKAGAGAIKVAVGTTEKSYSVTAPSGGGTTRRDTDELVFSPAASGKVKITVDCTTNSIYIWSVTITEAESGYSLSYNANKPTGATGNVGNMPTNPSDKATSFTVDSKVPTLAGYKFLGWATSSSGAVVYQPGVSTGTLTENKTLYAKWQAKTSVSLSADNLDLDLQNDAGGVEPLNPNQTGVTYTVDDTSVATYSGGKFYPQAVGETLVAMTKDEDDNNVYVDGAFVITVTSSVSSYAVTWTNTNATVTGSSAIYEGEPETYTITAASGYKLPETVSVSGATSLYSKTAFNAATLTISEATGPVSFSVVGIALANYGISYEGENYTHTIVTTIQEFGSATITLTPETHYDLPASVSVTNAEYSYTKSNGQLVISNPTDDVEISVAPVARERYGITVTGAGDSAEFFTYSGDTEIYQTETATVTIAPDAKGTDDIYVITADNIKVDGATKGTYNTTTHVLNISNPTKAVTITVTPVKKVLERIRVETNPTTTSGYKNGDTLDTTGLVVKAVFNTGEETIPTENLTFSQTKLAVTGTAGTAKPETIYVYYHGKSTSFDVTVSPVATGASGWNLVTKTSDLKDGDEVIIAASDYNYAISTTQNGNNRGQASITKNGSSATFTSDAGVQEFTLNVVTGGYEFDTGSGYLYAASSSSNYLRTQTDNNANGVWTISISDNVAAITATGTNTRNVMQYNASNNPPMFSCYGSASQKPLCLYKHTEGATLAGVAIDATYTEGSYTAGETIDLSKLTTTLVYNDGTSSSVSGATISPSTYVEGTAEYTVTYSTYSTVIQIANVAPAKQMVGIAIDATNVPKAFVVGGEFSYEGLVVYKVFDNETQELLETGYNVDDDDVDMSTAGTYTVYVTYGDFEAQSYEIEVSDSSIMNIVEGAAISGFEGESYNLEIELLNYSGSTSWSFDPASSKYYEIDVTSEDDTGLKASVTLNEATTEDLTVEISEANSGATPVEITIHVEADYLTGIDVISSKTAYTDGDYFDYDSVTVRASYASSVHEDEEIDITDCDVTAVNSRSQEFDLDNPLVIEIYTITVVYGGEEDSFNISVSMPEGLKVVIAEPGESTTTWEKVEDGETITDGEYQFVYEVDGDLRFFNNVDGKNGYIVLSETNAGAIPYVTIEAMSGGYSIRYGSAGQYICGTSGSNGITTSNDPVAVDITINEDGKVTALSNSTSFRFNASDNNNRFRFFKTSTTGNSYIYPELYRRTTTSGEPSYDEVDVSPTLYAFIRDTYTCEGGGLSTLSGWDDAFDTTLNPSYASLSDADKTILQKGVVSGVVEGVTKESWDAFAGFITSYDKAVASGCTNYLDRGKTNPSRVNPILALSNVDNSVWIISAVALVGLTAIGGYFFYRKRKEI